MAAVWKEKQNEEWLPGKNSRRWSCLPIQPAGHDKSRYTVNKQPCLGCTFPLPRRRTPSSPDSLKTVLLLRCPTLHNRKSWGQHIWSFNVNNSPPSFTLLPGTLSLGTLPAPADRLFCPPITPSPRAPLCNLLSSARAQAPLLHLNTAYLQSYKPLILLTSGAFSSRPDRFLFALLILGKASIQTRTTRIFATVHSSSSQVPFLLMRMCRSFAPLVRIDCQANMQYD